MGTSRSSKDRHKSSNTSSCGSQSPYQTDSQQSSRTKHECDSSARHRKDQDIKSHKEGQSCLSNLMFLLVFSLNNFMKVYIGSY